MVTDSQYLRFQTQAGGVTASPLQLLRVCYSKLSVEGKSFSKKDLRKEIYKDLLSKHRNMI